MPSRRAGRRLALICPRSCGQAREGAGRAALWLGPDEWLLIAEDADPASLGELEAALAEPPHSRRRLASPDRADRQRVSAARTLNAGCPLDFRLSAFPIGMATRTLYDKAEIVLWRRAEAAFQVEVWRSFAPYLVASLAEAARGAPQS